MALQPITGYPSSWKYPFTAAQISFNQGASTAAIGGRDALLVMPMTSAGTYTANTVYEVRRESDVRTGAGAGSPLHRAARFFLKANNRGKLFVLPYAATSGGSPAAATATITVSGTPTATGTIRVWVCGEMMTIGFKSTSTATTIGDAIEAAINAKTHLPLTAANSTGTVTLTAKIAGASQGDGTTGVHRVRVDVEPGKGAAITTTGALGIGAGTDGADGTTTEAANLTTALASIDAARYYYIGASVMDATGLAALKTHIATKNEPSPGLRCVGVSGHTGTLSTAAARAIALNHEYQQIVWQPNSEHDVAELVGQVIAIRQKYEAVDSAVNLNGYSGADWLLQPAYSEADFPDSDDLNDAVTDGLAPIQSFTSGRSALGMNITTRSKDSGGTLDDFRSAEAHRPSVMHDLVDTIVLRHSLTYRGKKLRDDVKLADGSVNTNQRVGSGVVTPSLYRPFVAGVFREFAEAEKIQDLQSWIDSLALNIDPSNTSRLECGFSGRTIDHHNQTSFAVSETTPN